ncbi:hypothetical protein DNTS_006150 [Danionella cerebrum]|uniref:Forkhead box protein N3 n=1 Tax=Danionella cerebrum TaxID=2873325 RepID=A0A553RHK6_9TELE|nr:hypothetical protein DNTS_006150 [Danionella translucida]
MQGLGGSAVLSLTSESRGLRTSLENPEAECSQVTFTKLRSDKGVRERGNGVNECWGLPGLSLWASVLSNSNGKVLAWNLQDCDGERDRLLDEKHAVDLIESPLQAGGLDDLASSFSLCESCQLGRMGPVVMPPGKKVVDPSSGSLARALTPLYQDTEADDLSLSLSASLSRAQDEELTSLSWLHESTDLLTRMGHSGLRSVSPVQDGSAGNEPSPSPSSSPEPSFPCTGPSRKPPYSFSCLIFMAIEDAPSKRLPVKDIYGWILEHFPYFASAPTGWKNSVRHNLSLNKCFKKVDKDRSQSIGKGSLWSIDPDYRHNLIQALKKTPYQPYSPRLPKPSTSPSVSPQQYHSPPLWPGSALFGKNGGVLLQVPQRVIQHGSHVAAQGLFPVIRPLPLSPVSKRTTAVRSALGDFLSRAKHSVLIESPSNCDEQQEDHTYSSWQCPLSSSPSTCPTQDSSIPRTLSTELKLEQKDFPLDRRLGMWTKGHLQTPRDTLPLKKRRAENILVKEEEDEEEEDEEMKEAAGSLLHLAGVVRSSLSKKIIKVQKELKEEDGELEQ